MEALFPVYLHPVGMRIGEDEFGMKIGFSHKLGVGFNAPIAQASLVKARGVIRLSVV